MLSSIQRADAAAGILAAASSLLMCPCSCLIKNFCLVRHHLLSPFLSSSETVVCQRGPRDTRRDILGSWMAVVALVHNCKICVRQGSCYPAWAATGRSVLPSNLKQSRRLKVWKNYLSYYAEVVEESHLTVLCRDITECVKAGYRSRFVYSTIYLSSPCWTGSWAP